MGREEGGVGVLGEGELRLHLHTSTSPSLACRPTTRQLGERWGRPQATSPPPRVPGGQWRGRVVVEVEEERREVVGQWRSLPERRTTTSM